ncbi:MAG: tetratricopeptide repeat protein [Thiotrichales bacterium]|nr:tetratricopeptide repeat protein [Thiotrichales bacterium]
MQQDLMRSLLAVFMIGVYTGIVQAAPSLNEIQQLAGQGKLQQALNLTGELLSEDPGNIEARFYRGLLLTKSNQLDQAEDVFMSLITDHPDLPEPYNNLAVVYAAQGKYDKARELLSRAINTHPSYATAHENLGDIYAKMASRAYNQVLELDDNNASAREKLSLISELFSRPEPLPPVSEPAPAEPVVVVKAGPPEAEPVIVAKVRPARPGQVAPATEPRQAATQEPQAVAIEEPAAVDDRRPDVLTALDDWANAWSGQDINAYLSHYSEEYIPARGLSRGQWKAQRKERLAKPKFIKIRISTPVVTMRGDNHAEVNFTQSYQSDTYSDRVKKTVLFTYEGERWLIAEERSK